MLGKQVWTGRVACLVSLGLFAPEFFWGEVVSKCPGVANSMPVMQCTIEGSDHPVGGLTLSCWIVEFEAGSSKVRTVATIS